MTDAEKIERYKALQMAIRVTVDRYRKTSDEAAIRSEAFSVYTRLYERTVSDVYKVVAQDLEKWLDEEHK